MRKAQVQSNSFVIGGRYEIKDPPIGQGGMGVVYKAYDGATRRFVAVKTIWGAVNPAALVLFEKEWSVLARLSHPNIVDIIETGQFADGGQSKPYFVMPLLPGVTLDHLIRDASPRLTVETTVEIMAQTCRGLQAAHDQGLIHRDLKPSNIFVLDDNSVKIIDFGVVHLTDSRTLTEMKGTLNYLAPELLGRKAPSVFSDIFALAVVCYEALTGRKPFGRPTENETIEAVLKHVPPPVSEMNSAANQRISRTIHKAMAKQPWHRFASAREFSDTLQKALRNEPIEYFDPARIQPRIERVRKAQGEADYQFAKEILSELEAEGHIDLQISMLRMQLDHAIQEQTVRHLMESARTRTEEEEYPLALQKVQEVLEIVPQHVGALHLKSEIERHRNEKQLDSWYRIVHQHLDNRLFTQARQALEEVLRIQPSDAKAQSLLARIDREEKEAIRLREEKEQLYQAALRCYQGGEVSTALDKLERLLSLSRGAAGTDIQEREAQYQSLYNQIRSEREAFRNAYAEARRHVENGNFERALALCTEFLRRNPLEPMFQALKLEAEESERQERSAAVAAVRVRLEAEADLDRQISILKEAAERYPSEPHFQESLKLVRDRRDLVNSILNRARNYEQRDQFNEALGQWDILRNIYPKYPGLDVEAERLARKRDEQAREETKARLVRQIDHYLESGECERAQSVLRDALAEFPGDRELTSMEKLVTQTAERQLEAQNNFDEGVALCSRNQHDEALPKLRKAFELNDRSRIIRITLVKALVDKGRILVQEDWRGAQALVNEALHFEPNDPIARSLLAQIQDQERLAFIEGCVYQARELQTAGNLREAVAAVRSGMAKYPHEARFTQLEATLLKNLTQSEEAGEFLPTHDPLPQRNRRLTPIAVSGDVSVDQATGEPVARLPEPSDIAVEAVQPPACVDSSPPLGKVSSRSAQRTFVGLSKTKWAGIVVLPILFFVVLVAFKLMPQQTRVRFHANVDRVKFFADGRPVDGDSILLRVGREHRIEASREGYETATQEIVPGQSTQGVEFNLKPLLPQLHFSSNLAAGNAWLGDQGPIALQSGEFNVQSLLPGNPMLKVTDEALRSLEVLLRVEDGKSIALNGPIAVKNCSAALISVNGTHATIYASSNAKGNIGKLPSKAIPADGMQIEMTGGSQEFTFSNGQTVTLQPSSQPSLIVSMIGQDYGSGAIPEKGLAFLRMLSVEPEADVYIDGEHWGKVTATGFLETVVKPGTHRIVLTKFQYEDSRPLLVHVQPGQTERISGTQIPLVKQGSLALNILPTTATVHYETKSGRAGQHSGTARANETIFLKPGTFAVHIEAPGYSSVTQMVQIASGQHADLKLTLPVQSGNSAQREETAAKMKPPFEDISIWSKEGDWWTLKTIRYGWLQANHGAFSLSIKKKSKGILVKSAKRVEWSVDYHGDGDRVMYWIDDNVLHRRALRAGVSQSNDSNVALPARPGDVYRLILNVSPFRISVSDETGRQLDEFDRPNANAPLGKIGFLGSLSLSIKQTR